MPGTWHNAVEEQRGDALVFRPSAYELPRVRGRKKITFNKNCEFVYYRIAPADGFLTLKGTYALKKGKKELVLSYHNNNRMVRYKIITLSGNVLRLKLLKP